MNRLSCFCDGCIEDEGVCKEREERRPSDVEQLLAELHHQTGDNLVAHQAMRAVARNVMDKAKEGDMVGLFVPENHRVGGTYGKDTDIWAAGRYMVAQLAENMGPIRNTGTRTRASEGAKVKVFLPEEVKQEHSYLYASREVCRKEGDIVEVGTCNCGKKHYTAVPVTVIRGGPWSAEAMEAEDDDDNSSATPSSEGEDGVSRHGASSGSRRQGNTRVPSSRGLSALQEVYAMRRGLLQLTSSGAQRLVLPVGVRQTLDQLDRENLERYHSTLAV